MNRKATPFTALAVAASVAIAPIATAGAAATVPAVVPATAGANSPLSAAQVVQSVSGATGVSVGSTGPAIHSAGAQAPAVAPLVVVTGDAASTASATSADPIALPTVPDAVTAALDLAGLPVAAVWRVFQTGNGIYTVFYKLAFNTIPNALLKGQWGSIPTAFETAVKDSLTWITTGAGPKAPETGTAPKATTPTAPSTTAVPPVITNALNVVGIPVATAWATFQAANTVYTNFTSLVNTVPNAFISGNWGKIPTLVIDAVTKSITTIVDFPGSQIKAASKKIDDLIASLTPTPAAPTATSVDALTLTRTSTAVAEDSVATSAADDQKPATVPVAEASKPSVQPIKSTPAADAEPAKPVAEPAKPVDTSVAEPTKPAGTTTSKEAEPTKSTPTESAPASKPSESAPETKPTVEGVTAGDAKPAADAATPASKPEAESSTSKAGDTADSSDSSSTK